MSDAALHEDERVNELALSIAWHAGLTRTVTTTDGVELVVVFPGHWTHGHGPDFRDAMIEHPGGQLVTGAVELHHRTSDWTRHGHHTDPAYNAVTLHIVTNADTPETRRLDGAVIPTAVLTVPDAQLRAVQQRNPAIWTQFGGDVCAPELANQRPEHIRSMLWHLGDARFEQRVLRFEAGLASAPPVSMLAPVLFEAFGYSRNRDQMLLLAERLDWNCLASRLYRRDRASRVRTVMAIMLGIGGWMPISPAHASMAGLTPAVVADLEAIWLAESSAWQHAVLPATIWDTARVRPANHPVARVATLSALMGSHGSDLVPVLINGVRDGIPAADHLQNLASSSESPPLGHDRAIAIAASVVLPFITAYARSTDDDALEDATLKAWSELPAGTVAQPARRARQQVAGDVVLRGLKERGNQGLLYLDKHFCTPRRCYECAIARAVVADALSQPASSV